MVLEAQQPRRTGWWVASALLTLGSAGLVLWLLRAGPTVVPDTLDTLAVGDGAPAGWRALCVAGPYEFGDASIERLEGVACHFRNEVPSGRSLLVYVGPDERCTTLLLPAPAFPPDVFDTRCFTREDVEGRELHLEGGAFKLRSAGQQR